MADLFKDILPSIMRTKDVVITEENEKDYVPFIINRSLSYHYDCIMDANQMNLLPSTPGIMQYHYYLNRLRAYKRPFKSWQKLDRNENLELVKEYYNYSNEKAKQALEVLSDEQLETIKKELEKGGIHGKSKRSN